MTDAFGVKVFHGGRKTPALSASEGKQWEQNEPPNELQGKKIKQI